MMVLLQSVGNINVISADASYRQSRGRIGFLRINNGSSNSIALMMIHGMEMQTKTIDYPGIAAEYFQHLQLETALFFSECNIRADAYRQLPHYQH